MQYPFADKKARKISSPFGWRVHPITKVRSLHKGVDMVDKSGTLLAAPEDSTVLEARQSTAPGGGYGHYVKLRGKSGTVHILAHMIAGSIAVKKGQKISEGTVVGKMGTSGASTGVHLHWETLVKNVPVDPITWFEEQTKPKPTATIGRAPDGKTYAVRVSNASVGSKILVTNNGTKAFAHTIKTDADATSILKNGLPLRAGSNRIVVSVDDKNIKTSTLTRK